MTDLDAPEDDEAPPLLVHNEDTQTTEEAKLESEMQDMSLAKVPITIVTGTCFTIFFGVDFCRISDILRRRTAESMCLCKSIRRRI